MKFAKGLYVPKNPAKYIGRGTPMYRSSWEHNFFMFCDNHPSVIRWAGEGFVSIPYFDPLTQKNRKYFPDVLIEYIDVAGVHHTEMIEIKPAKQAGLKKTRSKTDMAHQIKNHAKWEAAMKWCQKNGIVFRVVTEDQMFGAKR